MEDDFHGPVSQPPRIEPQGILWKLWRAALSVPPSVQLAAMLAPLLLIVATRLLSERPSRKDPVGSWRTVWLLPYWLPFVGHGLQMLRNPKDLLSKARDHSNGVFALNIGSITLNMISDPGLVKSAMTQKQSILEFHSVAWNVVEKFFGISNKILYDKCWPDLISLSSYLMKEPGLSNMLRPVNKNLEQNIPQMISFLDTEVDLQPWEKWSNHRLISENEVEIELFSLMRDMLGNASVPGLFGRGLLDKYPRLLQDIYEMDLGMMYFLMGLPAWTPWPGVLKAHMARHRLWEALDDQQRSLDKFTDGEEIDYSWGDMDDVSDFIKDRHKVFKGNGFKIKERGDLSILWAMNVNANALVYWQLIYILSTPSLLSRILSEIAPHVSIAKPTSIGRFSEAPKLSISHEGLAKKCPLFKSTYLEALRISSEPWSVRKVAADVTISRGKTPGATETYKLNKGEYLTIPHELHMRDPSYFPDPDKFLPDRFLIHDQDGAVSAEPGTIRPFGGGPSMCKGRVFAERECLALVAGVLAYWDFEPIGQKWVVPEMVKTSGISRPKGDTRVRVRRKKFDWSQ